MKKQIKFIMILLMLCVSLLSCGNEGAMRPVDYAGSKWTSEAAQMEFAVTEDGISDATIINKSGVTVNVTVSFADDDEKKMTVTNAINNETIFVGECTFNNDSFKVSVTDIFDSDFDHLPIMITFNRSDI